MSEGTTTAAPPEGVSDDAFLLAYLESHEAACPACGYNVHRLHEPRCPECGVTLTLRVVSPDRLRKSWLLLMVASSVGAGVGLFSLMVIVREGWPRISSSSEFGRMVGFNIVLPYFLAMIPAPVLCLLLRRWISGRLAAVRRTLALVIGIITLAMTITFLLLIVVR